MSLSTLGALLLWQAGAKTVTLTTTLTSYDDIALVITSIGVTRDKEKGNVAAIDLTLEEVVFAESAVGAPVTEIEGMQPTRTKGKISTKPKPKPKSLLLKGLGG